MNAIHCKVEDLQAIIAINMDKNNIYLASKPRYEILDGLRGIAASLIVAYHLIETYFPNPLEHRLNHGYLAVDFFFMLSGFVIGYAYDDRWNRMSTLNFFKRRLLRLHPMVIFGCLFGALLFYLTGSEQFALVGKTPVLTLVLITIWCMTIIPLPASMDIRGWAETNPLNGPIWTLQWEYLANILYALIIRRLPKAALTICVGIFGLMTIMLCLNIDWLGVLDNRTTTAYTVIGGWSLTPEQLLIGFTRLLYPFFMGLLISRYNRLIKVHAGFWWCSGTVALALIMPRIGGTGAMWMNGIYEASVILLLFPLVVSMGAGSTVTGKSASLCRFFGEISYPLYITHYPLVYLQMSWAGQHPDASLATHVFVCIGLYSLAIFNAWASYKLYDAPIRTWLKKKLFKTPAPAKIQEIQR